MIRNRIPQQLLIFMAGFAIEVTVTAATTGRAQ
jgi:hypothetical protein